ncbi:ArsA family ATPase [Nakamurella lactea]|uniref:ArsA family ATPase n=1 Tax=Nakamurella lactea TaxID=459515 RepID=UPI0004118782|nr:hypothetical protein [Nakamurella lactea]
MKVALVAGPGGSGVTTVAALTAVAAAGRGSRTVLVSSDPSTMQILGADRDRPGLTVVRPDPAADAAAGRPALSGYLRALGLDDDVEAADLADLPGAGELSTLYAIATVAAGGDCDALVVDAGARAVDLLAVPETVGRLADLVLPAPMRILRQFGGLLGGRRTANAAAAPDLVGAVLDRLLLARMLLTSGAALHLVCGPQRLRRDVAAAMVPVLAVHGIGLGRVLCNRADGTEGPPAVWPAETLAIPAQPDEPTGAALDALVHIVFGDRDPLSVTPGPAFRDPLVIRTDGGFRMDIPIPLAERKSLDLVRSGSDLLVTVLGRTRRIELPSVLRRCRVAGAGFSDGALSVSFVADPAQWPRALHPDGDTPPATASAAADART